MKHEGRVETAPKRRKPIKPASVSRGATRGTLEGLISRIDAARGDGNFGAAFRAGGLVRQMRRDALLSQRDLADILSISQARISEIEAGLGTQGPTWDLMERIASACGRTIGILPDEPAWTNEIEGVEIEVAAEGELSTVSDIMDSSCIVRELHLETIPIPAWEGEGVLVGSEAHTPHDRRRDDDTIVVAGI